MRPGYFPVIAEILRIGNLPALRLLRLFDPEGDAVLLGIGDRLLARFEEEPDLALHVAGGSVAHQRVDLPALLGLEFQDPVAGLGRAGLHGGPCWAENAGGHGQNLGFIRSISVVYSKTHADESELVLAREPNLSGRKHCLMASRNLLANQHFQA